MTTLTHEEEVVAILKWQHEGDIKARDVVIDSQMGLIVNLSRKLSFDQEMQKDLVQEGVIGVMNSLHKFNPSLGFRLSTYLSRAAWQQMMDYKRRNSRNYLSQEVELMSILSKKDLEHHAQVDQELGLVMDHMNGLNMFDQQCVLKNVFNVHSEQIAENWGKTKSWVNTNAMRIRKDLVKILNKK